MREHIFADFKTYYVFYVLRKGIFRSFVIRRNKTRQLNAKWSVFEVPYFLEYASSLEKPPPLNKRSLHRAVSSGDTGGKCPPVVHGSYTIFVWHDHFPFPTPFIPYFLTGPLSCIQRFEKTKLINNIEYPYVLLLLNCPPLHKSYIRSCCRVNFSISTRLKLAPPRHPHNTSEIAPF